MTVFTIGYEGLDIDTFVALLAQHSIDTVVDIRELPLSRKRGFSKKALGNALKLHGHEYVHLAALGCPKTVRNDYRDNGDWKRYTKGFARHLNTQAEALASLSAMTVASNCALLCYEADFNRCHRSLVANALRDCFGAEVEHIQAR
jgi:uncharacterized protein (DUF488 family)